jgi:excisionase family DNA binding protein
MATANEVTQLATILAQLAQTLAEHKPESEPPSSRPMPERTLLTVEEAAHYLGVGRTLMYQLIKDKQIATVQIHRLRRVSRESLDAYSVRIQHEQNAA